MYDIVIIGAGTAGLTAAIYARRAEKKVLVLEAVSYGGQIINTLSIENYPGMYKVSGPEFAKSLYEQAKELGAEIEFEFVKSRMLEHRYIHRGHAVNRGAFLGVQRFEHVDRAVVVYRHHAAAVGNASHYRKHQSEAVEEGNGYAEPVRLGEFHTVAD